MQMLLQDLAPTSCDSDLYCVSEYRGSPIMQGPLAEYHANHAIHGRARHLGARWRSVFNDNEQGMGSVRRELEFLERGGRSGKATASDKNVPKAKLIETYNAKAVLLLKGSGFVEAFHLLSAAVELSLIGDGLGAMPARGGPL